MCLWEEEGEEEADSGSHNGAYGCFTAKEGEDHEDENDSAITVHNALKLIGVVAREKAKNDFLTVERADREEVKNSKRDIGGDKRE